MSRRRFLGATIVWLAVVASASALVWVVISRAGQDLVASEQPMSTAGTTGAGATPVRPSGRPSRTPSTGPSRTPSTTPSGVGSAPSSPATSPAAPTASATPAATPTPTPSTSPSTRPSSPTRQPTTPVTEERRTWQGATGSITAACEPTGAPRVSAQPANGFQAQVHREDSLVDVEFEGHEDEKGLHVSVIVRCVSGVPSFSAQSEQDH